MADTFNKNIHHLRKKVDQIDKKIIEKISERMQLSRAIGVKKKKHGLPIRDRQREQKTDAKRERLADALGLNKKLIARIFKTVINESRKIQR